MRTKIFAFVLIFCMAVLLLCLAYVQIGRHERYRVMSEENRLKVIPLMAPRGGIFDRNGNVLVKDVLCFDVSVIYNRIKDTDFLTKVLSSILDVPEEKIAANIKKARGYSFTPIRVATDIGIEKAVHIEEIGMDYPGLLLEVSAKREYLNGKSASNILGYLGLINRPEFERLKHYGYRINDLVGRDGIEKYYDDYLRGTHGGKQVEVDYRGREVTTLGLKEPGPGRDVRLTIDSQLQAFCDKLLEGKRGGIIAMNPENGEILAMSSAPSYDPEIFIDQKRRTEVVGILEDEEYPLLNRAIAGVYPPGSVFKVVIAAGALEEGVITPGTTFDCKGSLTLGKSVFHCWREKGHGIQALTEGLKNSCNVFFWRLGLILGVDRIAEYAERFGVGTPTGIDLPNEAAGMLPTREWKKKRFNEKWYKGETMNYSVGQGYLLCSPIQVARIMSVFANGGNMVKPHVVSEVGGISVSDGEREKLGISSETIEAVREGLREVVNNPRGTGMKAKLRNVVVAGKTGTAQTSKGKSHGWFAGFAPFEDAKLTVVVFDEYGGKGGYYAAETAGEVFKKADDLGLLK
ncbi:MAG: penicillin-binding protein 2 [Candidatus Omnitrophota bacterium]